MNHVTYLRAAITANGGTPTSYSETVLWRQLILAYGGTPTYWETTLLIRQAITTVGGTPTSWNRVYLLRQLLTALGVTPLTYQLLDLYRQLSTAVYGGGSVPATPVANATSYTADDGVTWQAFSDSGMTTPKSVNWYLGAEGQPAVIYSASTWYNTSVPSAQVAGTFTGGYMAPTGVVTTGTYTAQNFWANGMMKDPYLPAKTDAQGFDELLAYYKDNAGPGAAALSAWSTASNVDPGFTGVGVQAVGSYVKAIRRTGETDPGKWRMFQTMSALHVLNAVPNAGYFSPGVSDLDKTPYLFTSMRNKAALGSGFTPSTGMPVLPAGNGAAFTANTTTGNSTLTVTAVSSGTIEPGLGVSPTGVGTAINAAGFFIVSQLTGTPGGIGTYQMSITAKANATGLSLTAAPFFSRSLNGYLGQNAGERRRRFMLLDYDPTATGYSGNVDGYGTFWADYLASALAVGSSINDGLLNRMLGFAAGLVGANNRGWTAGFGAGQWNGHVQFLRLLDRVFPGVSGLQAKCLAIRGNCTHQTYMENSGNIGSRRDWPGNHEIYRNTTTTQDVGKPWWYKDAADLDSSWDADYQFTTSSAIFGEVMNICNIVGATEAQLRGGANNYSNAFAAPFGYTDRLATVKGAFYSLTPVLPRQLAYYADRRAALSPLAKWTGTPDSVEPTDTNLFTFGAGIVTWDLRDDTIGHNTETTLEWQIQKSFDNRQWTNCTSTAAQETTGEPISLRYNYMRFRRRSASGWGPWSVAFPHKMRRSFSATTVAGSATLTVTSAAGTTTGANSIGVGQMVMGNGVAPGTVITALGTGTGGTGTYTMSNPAEITQTTAQNMQSGIARNSGLPSGSTATAVSFTTTPQLLQRLYPNWAGPLYEDAASPLDLSTTFELLIGAGYASGNVAPGFTYDHKRGGSSISGATVARYTLVAADLSTTHGGEVTCNGVTQAVAATKTIPARPAQPAGVILDLRGDKSGPSVELFYPATMASARASSTNISAIASREYWVPYVTDDGDIAYTINSCVRGFKSAAAPNIDTNMASDFAMSPGTSYRLTGKMVLGYVDATAPQSVTTGRTATIGVGIVDAGATILSQTFSTSGGPVSRAGSGTSVPQPDATNPGVIEFDVTFTCTDANNCWLRILPNSNAAGTAGGDAQHADVYLREASIP